MLTKESADRVRDGKIMQNPTKLKLGLYFYWSKFFLAAKMLMNRGVTVRTRVFKRDIFFNNINCFKIIEDAVNEVDQTRIDIYKNIDCFIDVGAHIGMKTLAFHEVNPEAECVMFEPIATSCDFLRKNTGHISKSRVFEVAVSDREKKAQIFFNEDHLNVSSLDEHYYFLNQNAKKTIKTLEVTSKPLDGFLEFIKDKKNIYLKIDVEAKEMDALKGAQEFLLKVNYLEIEISQDRAHPISETLKLINRKFNIIKIDCFKGDDHLPSAINLLLELC